MFTAFARCEVDGKERHIALILEKGMKGFEVGERFDTMGLRGNDLRRLYFNDVKVPAGERPGRARRGLQDRDAGPQQRTDRPRHRVGGRDQGPARPHDRARQGAAPVRPAASPTSSWSRTRSAGWSPTSSALESMCYLTCGLVDSGGRGLLARVRDLQGLRDRVPLVRGEPGDAAQGRRGLHEGRALREDPARHPHLPDLRGGERRHARVRRAVGDEARRREALGAGRDRAGRPDRLDRGARRLRRRGGSSARCAPTGSARRTPS